MKKLIIVGASGFGREVAQWVEDINKVSPTWDILGYLDDNLEALNGIKDDFKIIGKIHGWEPSDDEYFACALAFPNTKYEVVQYLISKGAKFATIIHPSAKINKYVKVGEGSIITPDSKITSNARIGKFTSILGSGVGHDAVVGDWSTLSGRCSINGHVQIGEKVYIACGVSIAPSKKVGDGATIGIGSVVISNVKAGTKVFGNPAKKIDF